MEVFEEIQQFFPLLSSNQQENIKSWNNKKPENCFKPGCQSKFSERKRWRKIFTFPFAFVY
jgi:hypothetical protein